MRRTAFPDLKHDDSLHDADMPPIIASIREGLIDLNPSLSKKEMAILYRAVALARTKLQKARDGCIELAPGEAGAWEERSRIA